MDDDGRLHLLEKQNVRLRRGGSVSREEGWRIQGQCQLDEGRTPGQNTPRSGPRDKSGVEGPRASVALRLDASWMELDPKQEAPGWDGGEGVCRRPARADSEAATSS